MRTTILASPAQPPHRVSSLLRRSLLWLLLWCCASSLVQAQEKTFRLNNVEVRLADVSAEVDVYFRSMRFNRALDIWNVEVTVSNKSERLLTGPLVLFVNSFTGSTGPVSPDGLDDSQPRRGFYDLSAVAGDGVLVSGEATQPRTLTLGRGGSGSPALNTQVFAGRKPVLEALGLTRSLDEAGRPLPGVIMNVTGPQGESQQVSDSPSGVASVGQGAGAHVVKFSADGYLPVWRRQSLVSDRTTVVPNPRLTKRTVGKFSVTPLGGIIVSNATGTILIDFAAGAVSQGTEVTLTPLSGQNLPAFLPLGWSPLNAFWLESSSAFANPVTATLRPAGLVAANEVAAVVRWDESSLQWIVTQTLTGAGTNSLSALVDRPGAYALVVGDSGPLAPPHAQLNQALVGSSIAPPTIAGLSASGSVTPPASSASVIPELVTGLANLELRHAATNLPSGYLLRGEVTETYLMKDGSLRLTPQYEHFIVGYQRPGDQDLQTLHATFPMRPQLLFGPDQLESATVRVDVLPEQPFDGQVLDAGGGQIGTDGVRILAGSGRLTGPSAFRLRRLDSTVFINLMPAGLHVIGAFDLTLDSSTVTEALATQLGGAPTNALFVLARVLSDVGYFGLQPIERLSSDALGNLISLEPATGERLPGLRGSGQFVLVEVNNPQALVSGTARNGAGQIQPKMPVSLAGLPWLTLTDGQGRYQLVGPSGEQQLSVRDPLTGDTGVVAFTVMDPGAPLNQDLSAAPSGPRVSRITPTHDATRVPRVGSVVIEFNEALNPATVIGNAIQLLNPNDSVVTTALTLNLANRIATLSSATELEANTRYRVRLAPTIADPGGLPLEGQKEFTFSTVPASTRDPAAQLIIYQPGATNVPPGILDDIPAYEAGDDPTAIVVHGTPGVADPEVPVILVNESTGETATVLSKVDGSFSSFISGSESDYVSATFVNLNGTRVYVPVSRQLFDDGFVGLYPQGGILEAQSDGGPVQVLIQPNAVPNRTKFRIRTLNTTQLLRETGGISPDLATVAGGGMKIEVEGQPPTVPMQLSFPVDLATLGYPATEDPTNAAAALAVVRDLQGVKTYEVVDQLIFEPSVTAPSRLSRIRPTDIGTATGGVLHTLAGFAPGLIQFAPLVYDFIVVPLVLGARPVVVTGRAVQATLDQSGNFVENFVFNEIDAKLNGQGLPGAFVILRNTPPIGPPGRLQPGMVHATSGADGMYLMMAPAANAGYILTGTHPRYTTRHNVPVIPYLDIEFSGVIRKDLVFRDLAGANAPLRLNIAHAPQFPAPNQDCEVQVSAFRGSGVIPDIKVEVLSVTNFTGDIPADLSDVTLTNLSSVNNGTSRLWRGVLRATRSVQAILEITADDEVAKYPINFAGTIPPVIGGPLPKPDTNDVHGPIVISTFPPEGGYLQIDGEITVIFNKPIERTIEQALSGIYLDGPISPKPVIRLNARQDSLVIQYAGLEPDREYTLTLTGEAARDLAGQSLDQRPSTPEPDSFRLKFRSPVIRNVTLPELVNGRGSAISGQNLYVIESTPQGSSLIVFDISNPGFPSVRARSRLLGQPRDLVVIPQYPYRLNPEAPIETNELVAVVGGDLDTIIDRLGNVTVKGQYLTLFNMANPSAPRQLASPILSYRVGSSVTKVEWSAPNLIYHEFGADIQLLGVVNVQELIVGFGDLGWGGRQWFEWFGEAGREGTDTNRDGDYADPGELLPIPPYPPIEFFGKKQNYVLSGTTQKILDFSPVAGGDVIGITLTRGLARNAQGQLGGRYPPSYRTLALNLEVGDPTDSIYRFDEGAYPRWVTVFESLPMLSNNVPILPTVALVSLQPDDDGLQKLTILDITLPRTPRFINALTIPEEILGGAMQSVRRREDGLLEVSGGKNVVLLNPQWLAVTNIPLGQVHPAIVGFVASAGAGTRSVGATDFGYHSVADGARGVLVQTPPVLSFVSFPSSPTVVDPSKLKDLNDDELAELSRGTQIVSAIPPARAKANPEIQLASDLDPPRPSAHFHVWVEAPGTSGETIELGLESVNHAGRPLSNFGYGFAPVRAVSEEAQKAIGQVPRPDCGAPIRSLTAWRMSNDQRSAFYNRYLSRPFALLANETLSVVEQKRLQTLLEREILHSGAGLRAFIDPNQTKNATIGLFAARIDERRKLLRPVASAEVITLFHPYLMGDNPPPAGGYVALPATYGMVAAHSGELRTEAADMTLPSPRMPVNIQRVIGNQDTYEGPFGVGWDFNYNQRITELDPLSFPLGLQLPLIVRASKENSDIAGSQDVLFNTGRGRVLRFRWVSTNMPPEYAEDPLVGELKYAAVVSDYYLPAQGQGIFDLLVKFRDGRFERLTPDGMRYRYAANGRLEVIIDRFPLNRHELEYDRNGWLVRIEDKSVRAPRFIDFGYYRTLDDPDFREGLDETTSNARWDGKVCRLRNYADGEVLFRYDDNGFLIRRDGIQLDGENQGFSGRPQTHYLYRNCRFAGIKVTQAGAPLFAVDSVENAKGKLVAKAGSGIGGNVGIRLPLENSAATLVNQLSSADLADTSTTEYQFDGFGHITSQKSHGGKGTPAETVSEVNDDGLIKLLKHPEGNSELLEYDSENAAFRSRGNLIRHRLAPGTRGGKGYDLVYNYDRSYNLKSGDQVNANGFIITYVLRDDRREVQAIKYDTAGQDDFVHNENGQLVSKIDARGVELKMTYDANTGFVRSKSSGESDYQYDYDGGYAARLGQPSQMKLPEGASLQMRYDQNLQIVERARGGLRELIGYDELGHPIFRQQFLGDGKAPISRWEYDQKGFLLRQTIEGAEVRGAQASIEHVFTPDEMSRIKSVRLPQGTMILREYDNRGNLIKRTLGDYVEEYEVDRNDNVIAVRAGGELVQSLVYDGFDQPKEITQFTGTTSEIQAYDYHPGGQVLSRMLSDDGFGMVEKVAYPDLDALGRPITINIEGTSINPSFRNVYEPNRALLIGPRMTTVHTWNSAGYRLTRTNAVIAEIFSPDGNGRIRSVSRVEVGATYTDRFEFDDLDNTKSYRDDLGLVYNYTPRADGKYLAVANARGHSTTMEHSVFGELARSQRADGMTILRQHDEVRQTTFVGDPLGGSEKKYDGAVRLEATIQRDGGLTSFSDFDARRQPQSISIPGGSIRIRYDLKERPIERTVLYQGTSYRESRSYDALDRLRRVTYAHDEGAENVATYHYDLAGPLLAGEYREAGFTFRVDYEYYDDLTRKSIRYPSSLLVSENRDHGGRLTGISSQDGLAVIVKNWQGNQQPKEVELGPIRMLNQYDARGRLVATRATRTSDGTVLVHMRYEYDAANNLVMRQFLHRGGRTDGFSYDNAERVSGAKVGGLPTSSESVVSPLYERGYAYNADGLDYLTSVSTTHLGLSPPPFASSWSNHDAFLLPGQVDGFDRSPADPRGNVQFALLPVRLPRAEETSLQSASFVHNGNGNLVRVLREDGVLEENSFQPSGLRYQRRLTNGPQVLDLRQFVYDTAGRLLEEYDVTGGAPFLIGRFFYATSDAPEAADLYDYAAGELRRFYYLRDITESVIAVADSDGNVVERVWYDAFGQPAIEARDSESPALKEVTSSSDGSLLIALSESVMAPFADPGAGTGIVSVKPLDPSGAVTVSVNSISIAGTIELLPNLEGYAPFSVLRFAPSENLPTTPTGVLGWWPGDNNVSDVIGGNSGALRGGAGLGPGIVQQGFALNGIGAFVEVTNAAALNFGVGDFTFSAWVNFNSIQGEQVLAEKWVQSSGNGWSLVKRGDHRLRLTVGDGSSGPLSIESTGALSFHTNVWIQIAARRQGGEFTLFTNGVAVATGTRMLSLSSSATLKFGSREGTSLFLNGRIDEVTAFSRALSDQEIVSIAGGVALPGPVTISLAPGKMADEWGNVNSGAEVSFMLPEGDGIVLYSAQPDPQTAAPRLARSAVESPFLFQGQYFDYDTGLLYLRARFYDPYAGMFLEPDPLGYEDSVNLYAGLGNNPVSYRDPSGLGIEKLVAKFKGVATDAKNWYVARHAPLALQKPPAAAKELTEDFLFGAGSVRNNNPLTDEAYGVFQKSARHKNGEQPWVLGLAKSIAESRAGKQATTLLVEGKNFMKSVDYMFYIKRAMDAGDELVFDLSHMAGSNIEEIVTWAKSRALIHELKMAPTGAKMIHTERELLLLDGMGLLPRVRFVQRIGDEVIEFKNPFLKASENLHPVAQDLPNYLERGMAHRVRTEGMNLKNLPVQKVLEDFPDMRAFLPQ